MQTPRYAVYCRGANGTTPIAVFVREDWAKAWAMEHYPSGHSIAEIPWPIPAEGEPPPTLRTVAEIEARLKQHCVDRQRWLSEGLNPTRLDGAVTTLDWVLGKDTP